jgi:PhzF family phenazine biosynthesis protein
MWQVDAFAERRFEGNPAAVCALERWLEPAEMQAIAMENNLAETAFFVREGDDHAIRWFTPTVEMDLCGHATLASGWVVLEQLEPKRQEVTFASKSGPLKVLRADHGRLALDFPQRPVQPAEAPAGLAEALGGAPREVFKARDLLCLFDRASDVRGLQPNFDAIVALGVHGIIATAPGDDGFDFVSRFFAPAVGVPEDPATGSAHCNLVPFWAGRLGRTSLKGRQVSARGATFHCELRGDRVIMAGGAVPVFEGTLLLD